MRLLRVERVRDGFFAALVAVLTALALRFIASNPNDLLHYQFIGELWGVDFGTWPDILYTGAGGDGDIFAVLAAGPAGSGPSLFLYDIVFRYSRIGFSFLGWVLSFGREGWVLPALFLIGLLVVAVVGFASGYLRETLGVRSWLMLLNPALYIGFVGVTAEPLAILLLILALAGSGYWAAAALGITRPTYAVALVGKWRLLSVAVAAGILNRFLAVRLFDGSIFEKVDGIFSLPFRAYFHHASVVSFLVLAAAVYTIGVGAIRKDVAWALAGLLVVVLGESVTDNPINAVRAAGMLPVLWAFGPSWRPAPIGSGSQHSTD